MLVKTRGVGCASGHLCITQFDTASLPGSCMPYADQVSRACSKHWKAVLKESRAVGEEEIRVQIQDEMPCCTETWGCFRRGQIRLSHNGFSDSHDVQI